jgi:Tfp pilus assembly protein PilN
VRPVNLIPIDQRKGAARTAGAVRSPVGIYALFGVLGVALLCAVALVLTSNSINSKTGELSKVQSQEQGAKQVADALRPYGQFGQVQQARQVEISALVSTRFDWERALHQLSLAIPDNVWILSLAGSLSPKVDVSAAGSGGAANLRQKAEAPAFTLTGCTYSQHAVARMMTRMQNLDDVTDVQLAKSARKDDTSSGAGPAAPSGGAQAAGSAAAAAQDSQDCVGSSRITKFDLLIAFGGAPTASPGAATGSATSGSASTPSSTAQSLATANNAAATAQGASSSTGASPAGGK